MPYKLINAASHNYICLEHNISRAASVPVRLGKVLELLKPTAPKCPSCGSRMTQVGLTVQLPLDPTWIRPNLWAQAKAALTSLTAR